MNNPNNFNTGAPGRPGMGPPNQMMGPGPMRGGQQNMGPPGGPGFQNMNRGGQMGPGPGQFQTNQNMPPQNMMGRGMPPPPISQEPEKPQKLKIELSNKERGYYSNMLSKLETDGSSRIDGKQAVTFFKTSGVDVGILKNIWRICARSNVESLSRDEFYTALRLIAYAQNGIPPTEESVRQNIEVPFPQFKSSETRSMGSFETGNSGASGMSALSAPSIADSLPDLDHLNVQALNQNAEGSLIPGMNERLQQREVEKAQEKMSKSQDSPWFLSPADVQKYNTFFDHFNKSGSGSLNYEETQEAFMQTQLDQNVLETVWGLVDTEEIGEFDRKMFCMAMHLLFKIKMGAKCPQTLPHVLKACVTSYFTNKGGQPSIPPQPTPTPQMNSHPRTSSQPPPQPQNMNQQRQPPQNQNMMGGMKPQENSKQEEDIFGNSMGSARNNNSMMSAGVNRDSNVSKGSSGSMGMGDGRRSDPYSQSSTMNSTPNMASGGNQVKNMLEQTVREQEKMVQSRKDDISALNSQFSSNNQLLQSLKEKSERLRRELDRLNGEYKTMQNKVSHQNDQIKNEVNKISDMTSQLTSKIASSRGPSGGMGGMGSNQNTPSKQPINPNAMRGPPQTSLDSVPTGNFGGGGMSMSNQNNGMMSDRQQRMPNHANNDYGGNQQNNMSSHQMRPQSTDPARSSNIQQHNFGGMNMQNQQKPNDDNFFGNSGTKGGMGNTDDIDWGL